jgi:hypothetical protein
VCWQATAPCCLSVLTCLPCLPCLPILPCLLQRVGDLERRRAAAVQQTLGTFVHIYRSAVVPIQEIAGVDLREFSLEMPSWGAKLATCPSRHSMWPLLDATTSSPSPFRLPARNTAASGWPATLPACPALSCPALADQLQELLGQIDADADLESFTETAASSVRRWATGWLAGWLPLAGWPCRCPCCYPPCLRCCCRAAAVLCCLSMPAVIGHASRVAQSRSLAWLALRACSAEALSARQREAVDQICGEVLGSAEIVR